VSLFAAVITSAGLQALHACVLAAVITSAGLQALHACVLAAVITSAGLQALHACVLAAVITNARHTRGGSSWRGAGLGISAFGQMSLTGASLVAARWS
jgi:uncharacterized membrane protein